MNHRTVGDGLIILGLASLLYVSARLALPVPAVIAGPDISLAYSALPRYALLSTGRMTAAYLLPLLFSLAYGYAAARNRMAERVLTPPFDVLQSVPILSFLPVVLPSLSAVLPQSLAADLAAIVLIFTSQAWNRTYSFYQSMTTIPMELREAGAIFCQRQLHLHVLAHFRILPDDSRCLTKDLTGLHVSVYPHPVDDGSSG